MAASAQIEGAEQLRALGLRLADADQSVRAALAKGLRAAAKPVVAEIRAEVKGQGGSVRGAGARARAAHRLSRSKSTRASAAASAEKRSGLRATIAAATGATVSTGADRTNLAFRMRSSQLPPEQRTLGKRWNKAQGWRHPVFGRDVWVQQLGRPYFDTVIKANTAVLEAGVRAAMVVPQRILDAAEL
ncbi:hypothetical protein P3T37_004064 [Kitasatospora sp. MAA4]|uniref:hypothetical protein n=1 Tax=Kitasatospora sp. MAA4 TaxID=3035093 RepID=UPI002473A3C1|nr:hypothetical protein [Kitasatospora sp. MAA4]MDH6134660.1 hypothetical protein [Kitasatospora sp. MAA4]